jgi:phosphoglycerate dehydrogenase-like enzyme
MRIIACRRTPESSPYVDQLFPSSDLRAMFAQADHAAIAAPLTRATEAMVDLAELRALKPGAILVNVSRGPIVRESALIEVLRAGHLGGAGLDVFHEEPLPPDHPFWTMPNVIISPHYSGETVNNSSLPAQRFVRNLRAFLKGQLQEGVVDLDQGY